MNIRSTFALMLLSFLLSSCAHRTIDKVSYGESRYIETSASDAEFVISLEYQVAGVINDTDKFYFKSHRPKTIEHSDGTWTTEGARRRAAGKYRDGRSGWCNSSSRAKADQAGLDIDLSIRWGGKASGEIEKRIRVDWEDLPNTIRDESKGLTLIVKRTETS